MALVNGIESSCIDPLDRGFAYGDGVFRTLPARDGQPLHWKRHYHRLRHDCEALGIACPDPAILLDEARAVAAGRDHCVVKIIVTRGSGARGYRPDPAAIPSRVVLAAPAPAYPADHARAGIKLRLCRLRLAEQPRLAGIKHLNRLENVLARGEWDDPGIVEGLLLDAGGNVVEGTMSNVFLVEQGRLVTPALTRCGVAGVQRELVLEQGRRAGLEPRVEDVALSRVLCADEVFLTNSLIGIWPVREFENALWNDWPVAQELRDRVDAVVD